MEEVFPSYDLSGHRITTVNTHYRRLSATCASKFEKPDCKGKCSGCSGKIATAKCKARMLKCKGSAIGLSFPFMSNLPSLVGLFSGKDIELIEFRPPPFEVSDTCYTFLLHQARQGYSRHQFVIFSPVHLRKRVLRSNLQLSTRSPGLGLWCWGDSRNCCRT